MLGSLTFYRRVLLENFYSNPSILGSTPSTRDRITIAGEKAASKLPTLGHAIAGVMAGATVSFIAAPVEHIKARLQIQYSADKTKRLYSGPVDCTRKIVRHPHETPWTPAVLITMRETVPRPRHPWPLPRPLCNAPVPILFLLLVGLL